MADNKDVVTKEFNPRKSTDENQNLNNVQLRTTIQQLNKRIAALEKRMTAQEAK